MHWTRSNLGHLGDENAVQHFQATGSHLHSLVYWQSAKMGKLLYVWGQRDRRGLQFDGDKLGETPLMIRDRDERGASWRDAVVSANGDKDGILWAAIHATGDSWHESRPGILHAYDADDIRHELWNSLENPARDDCGNYSKMAPPTIANGKVYLASFGAENSGSGQFCVYGLLPDGPAPTAPAQVKATITADGHVSLSWPSAGMGTTYRVASSMSADGPYQKIAAGLTLPEFTGIVALLGTNYYTVTAVNSNGVGPASAPVSVVSGKPEAMPRQMVMH